MTNKMKKHEEELKSRILGDRDMFAYYLKEVLENELIENAAAVHIEEDELCSYCRHKEEKGE